MHATSWWPLVIVAGAAACQGWGGKVDDAGFIQHAGPNSMQTKGGTDEDHLKPSNASALRDPSDHGQTPGGDAGPAYDRK